ncbi:hypothetical protein ALC57_13380 [Trachymyrmex cornetzi]|uniref:Uncharacterized protein n=1 Tax=Trachymyrmex cornetzi TaxID=471704 RepID=A0A151IZP2_9HYME|nr:hypothetical protein ALC57_13380 [Trachymyrmex cornetzi]
MVYPKYLNFFTSSILFPFHLQSTSLLLPPPFLNLIIFVLSMFNSSPFLSTYPSSLSNKLLILPSSSANNTISFAYANPYTLSPAIFTPPLNLTHLFL